MSELYSKAKACKESSYTLMNASTLIKNQILQSIAQALQKNEHTILQANQIDIDVAYANHKSDAFIDRLTLTHERFSQIIQGIDTVIALDDPSNRIIDTWTRNDLHFTKKSVSIGVIGIIYEARANVSVDAAILCIKAGNSCFLRGSKDTIHSNKALVQAMKEGIASCNQDPNCIQLLEDTSHETAIQFMRMNSYLDLLIPRGSASLIQHTLQHASVPIIETGSGNCHVYVDSYADFKKAIAIIINAKCQRISVCNSCESILVHKDIQDEFLPLLIQALKQEKVIIHGDAFVCRCDDTIALASDEDYGSEYLALEISIKVVSSLTDAILHINTYSSHHSDVIISEEKDRQQIFLDRVDSAVVYANTSSRFSDGEQFGFGAEIGISTQKIHARGPMGLQALTSYKYLVESDGKVRNS